MDICIYIKPIIIPWVKIVMKLLVSSLDSDRDHEIFIYIFGEINKATYSMWKLEHTHMQEHEILQ